MQYIQQFLYALFDLSNAMAPYILFGVIFAGIMHELVPESIVTRHLGSENISSVIKSTLFGIPLPVCSCGVIPLASSIKKSGASKGATLSFLISTPITGVDSILATFGMFGWIFTIYRLVTSIVIAMVSGVIANIVDKDDPKFQEEEISSCCAFNSCCDSIADKKVFSFSKALEYAFVTLLGDIAKPLFWGLIMGAVITATIPENLNEILSSHNWLSYLIAIIIALPMYVCATASLPIAAGLMLSGVSAGAAFVFLSAGPATNMVTISVVKKMLGSKSLYIYLGIIIVGSILFGVGLDYIFDIRDIDPRSLIHLEEKASTIAILSTIFLWISILYFMLKQKG